MTYRQESGGKRKRGKTKNKSRKDSQVYEERKIKQFEKVIRAEEGDPTKVVTFKKGTVLPVDITEGGGTRRRDGRPRVKVTETAFANMWKTIQKRREEFRYDTLNLDNENHIKALIENANEENFEFTPGYIRRYWVNGKEEIKEGRRTRNRIRKGKGKGKGRGGGGASERRNWGCFSDEPVVEHVRLPDGT